MRKIEMGESFKVEKNSARLNAGSGKKKRERDCAGSGNTSLKKKVYKKIIEKCRH